ncbi:MAG: LytTR family DNA-binding domain-containing protein [Crocinitomicaceae bacterium]|jgi:two-component system LytT family response regulator|nr:LytTR family DNA-binding domain-containing protein [Crocinitomicaceae bacterium]
MKVILIDDEPLARKLLASFCAKIPSLEIVGECENGYEAVKMIEEKKPDLIFLDVQMPKLSGFEVLELLNDRPKVIFCTAFDEYAVKAFDENAIDYLLKPFLFDRFEQAIKKVETQEKTEKEELGQQAIYPDDTTRVVIKDGEKINILQFSDLIYFEAYDDYVKIYSKQGRFVKKQTMTYYEKSLPNKLFARIHRSYIISIDKIQRIEAVEKGKYQVVMPNDVRLPISRSAFPHLKERLGW